MRINKFISEAGQASRRGADKLITEGRVTINGKRATIGSQVEPGDDVRVNGNQLFVARNNVYIAFTNRSASRARPKMLPRGILSIWSTIPSGFSISGASIKIPRA